MNFYHIIFSGKFLNNASPNSVREFFLKKGKSPDFITSILQANSIIFKCNDKHKAELVIEQFRKIGMDVLLQDQNEQCKNNPLYVERCVLLKHIKKVVDEEDFIAKANVEFYHDRLVFFDGTTRVEAKYCDIKHIIQMPESTTIGWIVMVLTLNSGNEYNFAITSVFNKNKAKGFLDAANRGDIKIVQFDKKKHSATLKRNYKTSIFSPTGLVSLYKKMIILIAYATWAFFVLVGYSYADGSTGVVIISFVLGGIFTLLLFGFFLMIIKMDDNINRMCFLLEEINEKNSFIGGSEE